ncbi:hypothetical protein [Haloferula sp. BvORR071]|uniref:hypothetical protein n=1 Tax=Haloferula sp. BvORR071 TaxID=1396141 RepID=UPI00054D94E8|nr:hypothetical protein [Haloferula sp. BvORR071]
MKLFLDLDSNQFVSDPLFKAPVDAVSFKRGDAANLELAFVKGNAVTGLASGATIAFGIKESGKFDGDFLVFADDFTSLSNSYYIAPSFNTEALNDALNNDGDDSNDVASLAAMLEITWSEQSGIYQSSRTITANILNDVIKGSEGTPLELPDADDWLGVRAVLFSEAQSLTSGQKAQARNNIGVRQGVTDGSNAASGQIGEYIEASRSTPANIDGYFTVTGINLTPGDWDVRGHVSFTSSATLALFSAVANDAESFAGVGFSNEARSSLQQDAGWINTVSFPINEERFSLSYPTTVYLMASAVMADGGVSGAGRISARRIR